MMCVIDLEPCEFYRSSEVTARKPHRCSGCNRVIRIGERYIRVFGKFEGDVFNEHGCLECKADGELFAVAHENMNPGFSNLAEVLTECISDGDEDSERVWRPMLKVLQGRSKTTP